MPKQRIDIEPNATGATETTPDVVSMEHIRGIRRRDGIRAAMLALKDRFVAMRKDLPKRTALITPEPPIYDEIYFDGVRAMDADVDTFVGPPLTMIDPSPKDALDEMVDERERKSPGFGLRIEEALARRESAREIEMTRPPYGAPFDLNSTRAILAKTEHEPPSQDTSDALWIQLQLACDEVERLASVIARMHHMVDLTDPKDPIGSALTAAGAYGSPRDG
jgi:hypothetical protein